MNYCYITISAIVLRNVINLSIATESNIKLYEALYSELRIPPPSSSAFSFTNLSSSAFFLFGVRAEQPNKKYRHFRRNTLLIACYIKIYHSEIIIIANITILAGYLTSCLSDSSPYIRSLIPTIRCIFL